MSAESIFDRLQVQASVPAVGAGAKAAARTLCTTLHNKGNLPQQEIPTMATKEKATSQTKQPAKHAVKGQVVESKVVEGKVVQGKVVDNEGAAPRNAETARPTDLHPQTLQRLDPLTKTYQ